MLLFAVHDQTRIWMSHCIYNFESSVSWGRQILNTGGGFHQFYYGLYAPVFFNNVIILKGIAFGTKSQQSRKANVEKLLPFVDFSIKSLSGFTHEAELWRYQSETLHGHTTNDHLIILLWNLCLNLWREKNLLSP